MCIDTTMCEHCTNIVPKLYQYYTNEVLAMIPSSGIWPNYKVQVMLCEHCGNVAPQHWGHIATTFRQHCMNIVAMSLPNVWNRCWDNVQASQQWMLCQCRSPMLRNTVGKRSGNTERTFSQYWCPTVYLVVLGPERQLHVNLIVDWVEFKMLWAC